MFPPLLHLLIRRHCAVRWSSAPHQRPHWSNVYAWWRARPRRAAHRLLLYRLKQTCVRPNAWLSTTLTPPNWQRKRAPHSRRSRPVNRPVNQRYGKPCARKASSAATVPRPRLCSCIPAKGRQYLNILEPPRAGEPIVAEIFAEADRVMTPLLGKPLSEFIFVDKA